MKFIAILKDSLREAIDAKVFYVMVGLSLLLIFVAATARFTPAAGGRPFMELAAVPLSVDLSTLDPVEAQRGGDPFRLLRGLRGLYQVTKVYALDNAPDLPTSTFRVEVKPQGRLPFFFTAPRPEKAVEQFRERFGVWDDLRIAEVLEVSYDKGTYLIDARPTPEGRRLWPHEFSLFFGGVPVSLSFLFPNAPAGQGMPLAFQLYILEDFIVNSVGSWVAILVSVVITAFFIPNMLRKGTVDLLIVKPIRRPTLLLYKYVGGLLFILLNTAVAVTGVWLALSLRSGIWAPGFLLSVPVITFFFAILYAVSTLFGVLTRSPIVSILMTCGAWFFLWVVGLTNLGFEAYGKYQEGQVRRHASQMAATSVGFLAGPAGPLQAANVLNAQTQRLTPYEKATNVFARVVAAVHFVLPRTRDLDTLMSGALQRDLLRLPRGLGEQALSDRRISWGESLTVSGVFIALLLGASCWWFATRDY
jgi:ABC-type transport system involved in multi-copper enzyme maturation permease subunit